MDRVPVGMRAPSFDWFGAENEQQDELAASIHNHFSALAETLRRAADESADPAERDRLAAALAAARRGQFLAERLVQALGDDGRAKWGILPMGRASPRI